MRGRSHAPSAPVFEPVFQKQPVSDTGKAVKGSGLTLPTVINAFEELQKLGIVRETTGRERKRLYAYVAYLELLSQGTEPLTAAPPASAIANNRSFGASGVRNRFTVKVGPGHFNNQTKAIVHHTPA